jgi:hypothetical protein
MNVERPTSNEKDSKTNKMYPVKFASATAKRIYTGPIEPIKRSQRSKRTKPSKPSNSERGTIIA